MPQVCCSNPYEIKQNSGGIFWTIPRFLLNNLAERSLRLAVTKRKVSGGYRSMKRFEETADLLSVIQTCRFQARSLIAFFREALEADSCDFPMPELIPFFQT